MTTTARPMNEERFLSSPSFREFLEGVEENVDLWRGIFDRARLPEDVVEAARGCPGTWRLVALTADWCGDAVHTLPVVARFAEEVGWWGPRPDELQRWVLTEGRPLDPKERYKNVRRWYAKDRGRAAIAELLDIFCHRV